MSDELHKQFAWKVEGGYWRGQTLLPISQIRALLVALEWKYECFASIQSYTADGECVSSPLYMDLDGEPAQVLADARHLVASLEFLVNTTPRIYFSGGRGFHMVLNYVVEHPRCHLLAQEFAKEAAAGLKSLDHKVYRTFSMFRIPGSKGSVPGLYKTELTRDELMTMSWDEIVELAKRQRMITVEHIADESFDLRDWMKTIVDRLPRYDSVATFTERHQDMEQDFTPCLRQILSEGAPEGRRNEAAFLLARFLRSAGMDQQSAQELMLSSEPWAQFEREGREVSKVVKSVYRSGRSPRIGCRGASSSADLMRSFCSNRCFLAANMMDITPSTGS